MSQAHDCGIPGGFPCADKVETRDPVEALHCADKQTVAQRGERTCQTPQTVPSSFTFDEYVNLEAP